MEGKAKRACSKGRIAADDEGDLAIAVHSDTQRNRVIIHFGKKIDWIGLDANQCVGLANLLMDHARRIADRPVANDGV